MPSNEFIIIFGICLSLGFLASYLGRRSRGELNQKRVWRWKVPKEQRPPMPMPILVVLGLLTGHIIVKIFHFIFG